LPQQKLVSHPAVDFFLLPEQNIERRKNQAVQFDSGLGLVNKHTTKMMMMQVRKPHRARSRFSAIGPKATLPLLVDDRHKEILSPEQKIGNP
jgi:hypothetical protein